MPHHSLARRTACTILIAAALSAIIPTHPARALTTAREIQTGQSEDKQITKQYGVINDPLLTRWVNEIGEKLWRRTARKDVPYNIKILDASDINAFSTLGGYIYVNSATLDFVQSDDELAGVIGHETGHIERRHAVTYPVKAQALDLLLGIASLFVPMLYGFGQIGEAGVLAKTSRTQELQADRYGLLLMSRAGYDPTAMVSFMHHLGAANADDDAEVDAYLADHPGFPDRVAHLVGYPELDPTKRTREQLLVQALHDQQTSRYNIAMMSFQRLAQSDPNDAATLLRLGETQIALGLPHKAEQTLGQAALRASSADRTQALAEQSALSAGLTRFTPLPHLPTPALLAQLNDAANRQSSNAATLEQHREPGKDQLKALDARIAGLSFDIPGLSQLNTRPGTSGATIMNALTDMARRLNTARQHVGQVIAGVGSLEKNKESGVSKDTAQILTEMRAALQPLQPAVIPDQTSAILPYYPAMAHDLDSAEEDMIRAVDASRSAATLLDAGLTNMDSLLRMLGHVRTDFNGNIQENDRKTILPLVTETNVSLTRAEEAAAQAWQRYNLARARCLQTRITLLGLDYPRQRYATLQDALRERVKNNGLGYEEMSHDHLSPGETAAAAIIAADTNASPQEIVRQAQMTHQNIIDIADTRNMSAYALEVFLGLVYLDYTDDPVKEAHERPDAVPTLAPPSITERS